MDRIETSAELDFLSRPSYRHDDASHSISRAAASRRDKTIDDRRHGNMEECLRQLILAESASLCTGTTSSPCLSPPPRRDDASSLYLSRRAPPASSRCTNDTHTHTHTHDSPRIFIYSFTSAAGLADLFTNAMAGRYRTRLLIYQIHKRMLSSPLLLTDRMSVVVRDRLIK